jgi:hypothetical protein
MRSRRKLDCRKGKVRLDAGIGDGDLVCLRDVLLTFAT